MGKKLVIGLAAAGAAAAGAFAFMIAPARRDDKKTAPFYGRNYAHRGLHKMDKSVPENSIPAFDAAARIGYGVELDVHLSADGEVVVFHDDNLQRICGVDARVDSLTWAELSQLRLCGTPNRIPLLSEVLAVIDNRCPIIVELKRSRRNAELCRKTYELLSAYNGRYCIESFDPRIVFWFRRRAPEVLRGQLSARMSELSKSCGKAPAFCLSRLLTNFIARPHFIAYQVGRKPLAVKLCELMGAMRVAWTSLEWKTEEKADAVIFQYYRPRVKYK